jgi:hypothetical protein
VLDRGGVYSLLWCMVLLLRVGVRESEGERNWEESGRGNVDRVR